MKSNNLELALREYNPSSWNDKITYEKHLYNGFSGLEGAEAYHQHLSGLYDTYFIDLRDKIDALVLKDIDILLKFIQSKIDLFNDINDIESKNNTRWVDLNSFDGYIKRDETVDRNVIQNSEWARNDYFTMKFFVEMINTQNCFIDKAITELTKLYETYNPTPKSTISQNEIDKETWENTLSKYGDLISTFEVAKIFGKDEDTIRRWQREGKFTPIDKNARPMQFRKDEIKQYYLKIKIK